MRIRGLRATVRWGYHEAAILGAWTVEERTLTATIERVDRFRLAQQPLVFVAPHARGSWRWTMVECTVTGDTLTARLGPLSEA